MAERPWRRELTAFGELLAMTSFAVAQPLLDVVGHAVPELAAAGARPRQLVLYGFVVVLGPPLLAWVVEVLAGLVGDRWRRAAHLLALGGCAGAIVLQALVGHLGRAPLALIAVASVVGTIVLVDRVAAARLWLRYAAFAPVLFLGLFFFASPASDLLSSPTRGASASEVTDPAPVVVIVLDELPTATLLGADGEIDETLFPNLAAIQAESTWFRHATTVSNTTVHAVTAMLTGEIPGGSAPIAQQLPDNLFALLADDFDLRVSEVVDLCPATMCESRSDLDVLGDLLSTSIDILDQRISLRPSSTAILDSFGDRLAPVGPRSLTPDAVADFVAGFDAAADPPPFTFFHAVFPHRPFHFLPDGREYRVEDGPAAMLGAELDVGRRIETWGSGTWPATLGRQRHLLQVMYADRVVGAVRDRMVEQGTYDDTTLVILSDHGTGFDPDEPTRAAFGQEVTPALAAELLYVPFLVKERGQTEGRIDDRNALVLDLLPTIADVVGADLPYDVDGISLLGPPRSDGVKPLRPIVARTDLTSSGLGPEVTFDDATLWAELEARALPPSLGDPSDPWRLWRVGPRPDLVGLPVAEVPDGALRPSTATLRDPEQFTDVAGTVVPALVLADAGDLPEGAPVAIVVNGVVAATAPVFLDGDDRIVAAMVNPDLFVGGTNRVELFDLA